MRSRQNGRSNRPTALSRRKALCGIGISFFSLPLTGCFGGEGSAEYPGGSVIVENQADANSEAWFKPADDSKQPEVMTVAPEETKVVEKYTSASEGEAVTLVGRLGEYGRESDNKQIEIYPRGSGSTPPQVARMTITNSVAGEWEWSTEPGTMPQTQQERSISGVPMRGYNASRTGHAQEETGPTGNVSDEWYYESRGMVSSYPAVVNGNVYYGGWKGGVYAKDASAGSEKWKFETGAKIDSSPAVTDGTVYIGSQNGNVYALSASDGTEQWSFDTGESVFSSPAVSDGTVYVTTGKTGGKRGSLYALSASDGSEKWRYETDGIIISSPAVADGNIYFGNRNQKVHAVSVSDGTEQWTFETGKRVRATPAVSGDTVYIGSLDNSLYALSASDGTEQWSFEADGGIGTSPTVADGTVYFGGQLNVYALSASDGTEQWSLEMDGAIQSVVVADEIVYVGMQSAPRGVHALTA